MATKKKTVKKQYFVETLKIINSKSVSSTVNFTRAEFTNNNNSAYVEIMEDYIFSDLENTCSLHELSFDNLSSEINDVIENIEDSFVISFKKGNEEKIVREEMFEYQLDVFGNTWISNVNIGFGYNFFTQKVKEGKAVYLGKYKSTSTHKTVYIFGSKDITK